jgi:hypothetical protein
VFPPTSLGEFAIERGEGLGVDDAEVAATERDSLDARAEALLERDELDALLAEIAINIQLPPCCPITIQPAVRRSTWKCWVEAAFKRASQLSGGMSLSNIPRKTA